MTVQERWSWHGRERGEEAIMEGRTRARAPVRARVYDHGMDTKEKGRNMVEGELAWAHHDCSRVVGKVPQSSALQYTSCRLAVRMCWAFSRGAPTTDRYGSNLAETTPHVRMTKLFMDM